MASGNPNDDPRSEMNPYSSAAATSHGQPEGEIQLPEFQSRGMISQVPILSVLMVLQGVLEFVAGIAIAGYAAFMPQFIQEIQKQANQQGGPPPPPAMAQTSGWLTVIGGIFAVAMLLIGVMTIISGLKVYRLKGRTLAIVSLLSGLLTLFTCYCFPTSLALTVYGLIVVLNPSVKLGFDLQQRGYSAASIQRAFAILPLGR